MRKIDQVKDGPIKMDRGEPKKLLGETDLFISCFAEYLAFKK